MAVVRFITRQRLDGADRFFVAQFKTGFDFGFDVAARGRVAAAGHGSNYEAAKRIENRRWIGSLAHKSLLFHTVFHIHADQIAIAVGIEFDHQHVFQGFGGQRLLLGSQRHFDVVVALHGRDFVGHDEKYQQLEHDVDQRRHLQLDLSGPFVVTANFHKSNVI